MIKYIKALLYYRNREEALGIYQENEEIWEEFCKIFPNSIHFTRIGTRLQFSKDGDISDFFHNDIFGVLIIRSAYWINTCFYSLDENKWKEEYMAPYFSEKGVGSLKQILKQVISYARGTEK
ncbi:hypothetical protein KKG22_00915 [Patescibacteria group bacterium]|nr:hypothetical protein [Patescibacteria group bacterium]